MTGNTKQQASESDKLFQHLETAFAEQIAGSTHPRRPAAIPSADATPVPKWPAREGREL